MTKSKVDGELNIEKGIPVPMHHQSKKGKLASLIKTGESVLFASRDSANVFRLGCMYRGYRMISRKVDGGFRVWRIK